MRNPIFKKLMQEAFEKTAWPYDPAQVAEGLSATDPQLAAEIARGQFIGNTAANVVTHTVPEIGRAASNVASKALSPATAIGEPVLRGLGRLGHAASTSPRLMRAGIGLALAAPVLSDAFHGSQQRYERELMALNRDPERIISASLYDFLEKQAELTARVGPVDDPYGIVKIAVAVNPAIRKFVSRTISKSTGSAVGAAMKANRKYTKDLAEDVRQRASSSAARAATTAVRKSQPGFWESAGTKVMEGFTGGISGGIGKALAETAFSALGKGIGMLKDYFITDPKRQALLESLMKTDPIIHDAVSRDPKAKEMLLEAYGTMCRFAPTLSTDINAARSFLRETVLGGSGVNYAIIKSLIETEKALHAKDSKK